MIVFPPQKCFHIADHKFIAFPFVTNFLFTTFPLNKRLCDQIIPLLQIGMAASEQIMHYTPFVRSTSGLEHCHLAKEISLF